MSDTTCPYCNVGVDIVHDDGYGYTEDDLHQQECENCGKTFGYHTHVHFSYRTLQVPCFNGGRHDYRMIASFPPDYWRIRCRVCGDEKVTRSMPEVVQ